jgi:Pyridoxamine 5'-phosphate oxidase
MKEVEMELTQDVFDIINNPGRIGMLATADKDGKPNVAYFGSPHLAEDGTLVMGMTDNRSVKNLEQNPQAVFFAIGESPVTFQTPGSRLYLTVKKMEHEGELIDNIKATIAEHAGPEAASMITTGLAFEVTEVRPMVAMG